MSLLEVENLEITAGAGIPLVRDFSLTIGEGERVALVGESGSGKSVTARALLRLDDALRVAGSIRLSGRELLSLPEKEMAKVRGREVAMVCQDPLSALNPIMTIGDQVAEPLIVRGVSKKDARRRAVTLLDELGVPGAARRARAYPHEFSGGMRQRVAMAMALIGEPKLLVADEPTTALDVRVQQQVLDLLARVARERNLAVLLITHDIGVVAGFADRVMVLYSGRPVETAGVRELFTGPAHPYTRGLLGAVPTMSGAGRRLEPMPGSPPDPARRPSGCAFHPRCPVAMAACSEERPVPAEVGDGHSAACHLTVGAPV
ncbi:ABC transporter ATP-binding protein [Amycolatopsis sp.]|uniref:ABC transporter ATP-binding protein n=1 Tax=Amycolatopsis sp. TaxID=37632 RepID=UPI002B91DF74|nr:ABC transporter ATP-binding protein [Amycolatopsis sp.]HVV13668.1 ABC transporter ATP-binding protein [Amycolatopsis sp.]